jgi:hypothetical protein
MLRPPSALLHSGSVYYLTGNPLVYVAGDGRRIRLRAVQGHEDYSPRPAFGPWDLVPGYIADDCLFVGSAQSTDTWAIY